MRTRRQKSGNMTNRGDLSHMRTMVLEYLPTFARTKSPSFVGKYTMHRAYGYPKEQVQQCATLVHEMRNLHHPWIQSGNVWMDMDGICIYIYI